MRCYNRKQSPSVKAGRVQKKNNWDDTPDYYNTEQPLPVIDRKRPGAGYRHILKQRDIYDFIGILPDWPEMSRGLNAIVLAPGERNTAGYHEPGVVHVCAWHRDLWRRVRPDFFEDHRALIERLGVPWQDRPGEILCKWTENTARAYQLLHILLHELGHHHDRMTTASKVQSSRGEPFAEAYAFKYEALIWERYTKVFDL